MPNYSHISIVLDPEYAWTGTASRTLNDVFLGESKLIFAKS